MAERADPNEAGSPTIQDRPSVNQLLMALGVLVGAIVGSFIAGPGFGLAVVTLAALAAGIWISYGPPSLEATPPSAIANRP